jgi:ubiquinone/menaquinone biosynthesis C-methylase UbiE
MKFLENFPSPKSQIDQLRSRWVSLAKGYTLEVGFGSGLNLPHYTSQVKELIALDKDHDHSPLAQLRLKNSKIPVGIIKANALDIPFQDSTFDCVVMTWTLCSINDRFKALAEIKRVLKPDGRLIFIEHGLSQDKYISTIQTIWSPFQKILADGCSLKHSVEFEIKNGGFCFLECESNHLKGPKVLTYTSRGVAIKK